MNALYNEYLTGSEREAAIIIAESRAELAKLNVLFESVQAKCEVDKLAAEAKVFAENGTYDDLIMLYTEANTDADKKEGGILNSIFDAILRFFARIKEFFVGKDKDDIPEEVEIDAETANKATLILNNASAIDTATNKFKSGDYKGALAAFTTIALTAAGATGVVVWKADKIRKLFGTTNKIYTNLNNVIANKQKEINSKPDGIDKTLWSGLLKAAQAVVDFVFDTDKGIWAKIEAAKKGVKTFVDDKILKKQDENTEKLSEEEEKQKENQAKFATQQAHNRATEEAKKKLEKERPIPADILADITQHAKKYFNNKKSNKKYGNWQKRLDSIEDKIKYALNTEPDYNKALAEANKLVDEFKQYTESVFSDDGFDEESDIFIESELVNEEYNELVEAFAEL